MPDAAASPAFAVTSLNVPSPLLRYRIDRPYAVTNMSGKPSLS